MTGFVCHQFHLLQTEVQNSTELITLTSVEAAETHVDSLISSGVARDSASKPVCFSLPLLLVFLYTWCLFLFEKNLNIFQEMAGVCTCFVIELHICFETAGRSSASNISHLLVL